MYRNKYSLTLYCHPKFVAGNLSNKYQSSVKIKQKNVCHTTKYNESSGTYDVTSLACGEYDGYNINSMYVNILSIVSF